VLSPDQVSTDRANSYARLFDELVSVPGQSPEQYATPSKPIHDRRSPDYDRCTGSKQLRCARVISAWRTLTENIGRHHHRLRADDEVSLRIGVAFTGACLAI